MKQELEIWQERASKAGELIEQLEKLSSMPGEATDLLQQANAVRWGLKWEDDEDHAFCMNADCAKAFSVFRRRFDMTLTVFAVPASSLHIIAHWNKL